MIGGGELGERGFGYKAPEAGRDEVIDTPSTPAGEPSWPTNGRRAGCTRAAPGEHQTDRAGAPGDAEQILLDDLEAIKRVVTTGIDESRDLDALRNVIGQMFESIRLVRSGRLPLGDFGPDSVRFDEGIPLVEDGQERYWLLLGLCPAAVDTGALKPTGQDTPVPPSPQ